MTEPSDDLVMRLKEIAAGINRQGDVLGELWKAAAEITRLRAELAELADMEKCKNTYATLAYEREQEIFKLRAELAEAKRERDAARWEASVFMASDKRHMDRAEQAEAERDRFAAVIACRNIRAYAPLKEYCRVGEAAYPNCWTRMRDEAIAHHRAKEEEKNRG